MEDARLKKEAVLSMFGTKLGTRLLNLLDPCCTTLCEAVQGCVTPFSCGSVFTCLGISEGGNPLLVLNQQGNWVSNGAPTGGANMVAYFNGSGDLSFDPNFTRSSLNGNTDIVAVGGGVQANFYVRTSGIEASIDNGAGNGGILGLFGGTGVIGYQDGTPSDIATTIWSFHSIATAFNGIFQITDRAATAVDFRVDTIAGIFGFGTDSGIRRIILAELATRNVTIGDCDSDDNETTLSVNDTTQEVLVKTDNIFSVRSTADSPAFTVNVNTGISSILLPAFADDAAAGVGGLITNDLYQTDGTSILFPFVGVVMVKQ